MSTASYRYRSHGVHIFKSQLADISGNPGSSVYEEIPRGFESIHSYSHPWPPTSKTKRSNIVGRHDFGGPMQLLRKRVDVLEMGGLSAENGLYKVRNWNCMPNTWDAGGTPEVINALVMNAVGTKGWNMYKPTARKAGLDQFLGELRELPKAFAINAYKNVLKEFARGRFGNVSPKGVSKALAGDFLNFQFGWLPFYSELKDLLQNYLHEDELMTQLVRDNGRRIRRRGIVDIVTSENQSVTKGLHGSYIQPALPTALTVGQATRLKSYTKTERYEFSGRFRYWVPEFKESPGSQQAKERARRIIYGKELTPNTLYQLMPWSWLIDWVSPVGSVISNLNDHVDNLTADYAYATGHKTESWSTVCEGMLYPSTRIRTSVSVLVETKQRAKASPYGFGILPGTFSPKQFAILGALGVTRVR